jgi:hypothetical protein
MVALIMSDRAKAHYEAAAACPEESDRQLSGDQLDIPQLSARRSRFGVITKEDLSITIIAALEQALVLVYSSIRRGNFSFKLCSK